jgi:transcriptional regulator with XRE-family HTH domain
VHRGVGPGWWRASRAAARMRRCFHSRAELACQRACAHSLPAPPEKLDLAPSPALWDGAVPKMEQRQQIDRSSHEPLAEARHRAVPLGFVGLRADYGAILQKRRKDGRYGKQAVVALEAGIAAETLSRIENGRAVPRLETMDALLTVLNLSWSHVAVKEQSSLDVTGPADSRRRDRMFDAGQDIRDARRAAGLTLRDLSALSGVSLAQLSRVERGSSGGARIYQENPHDSKLPWDERRLVFANPTIAALVGQSAEDGESHGRKLEAAYKRGEEISSDAPE